MFKSISLLQQVKGLMRIYRILIHINYDNHDDF
jgi:hypothetical protein